MGDEPDDGATGGSSACFMHELVGGQPVDPETWRDVSRFRKAERSRLYEARRTVPSAERAAATARLIAALAALIPPDPGLRVAVYWPIRGEPDLRAWMTDLDRAGVRVLLPVVVERFAPLVFRPWSPGCRMARGDWNIPVPVDGAPEVPDVVISPVVGIDDAQFRLGNGGGYYDRTLAALDRRPWLIGIGFDFCRIRTIFPMPWDIPMQTVVLSDGAVGGSRTAPSRA